MQVIGPDPITNPTRTRKWFFDTVPDPLPQPGDYINTEGGKYWTMELVKGINSSAHIDKEGTMLQIQLRIFILNEHNEWIVQLSCS